MKRPAPVTACLVVLAVFLCVIALNFATPPPPGYRVTVPFINLIFAAAHVIALAGVVRAKRWGLYTSICVLCFWTAGMAGVGGWVAMRAHSLVQAFPIVVIVLLAAWLVASLFRAEVRAYFGSAQQKSPSEEHRAA